MVNICESFNQHRLKSKMILQVHDELVFDIPMDELEQAKDIIKNKMEHAVDLRVPLIVDMGFGKNWLEAH